MARSTADREAEAQHRCQHQCKARCCHYITVVLPAPRHKADFDELSWFLAHENISVYVECRRWHLEVRNRCQHLTQSNLCGIYDNRPVVCRSYATDVCEYPVRPKHTIHFDTKDEFDAWWTQKRERERRRRKQRASKANT